MSEKMGPLSFGKKEEQIFLGREIAQHRDYSESTAIMIDDEVKKLVTDAHVRTTAIITENLESLHRLANALLEREVLGGSEIDMVIHGDVLPEPKARYQNAADIGDEETLPKQGEEEAAGEIAEEEKEEQDAPPEAD